MIIETISRIARFIMTQPHIYLYNNLSRPVQNACFATSNSLSRDLLIKGLPLVQYHCTLNFIPTRWWLLLVVRIWTESVSDILSKYVPTQQQQIKCFAALSCVILFFFVPRIVEMFEAFLPLITDYQQSFTFGHYAYSTNTLLVELRTAWCSHSTT